MPDNEIEALRMLDSLAQLAELSRQLKEILAIFQRMLARFEEQGVEVRVRIPQKGNDGT